MLWKINQMSSKTMTLERFILYLVLFIFVATIATSVTVITVREKQLRKCVNSTYGTDAECDSCYLEVYKRQDLKKYIEN